MKKKTQKKQNKNIKTHGSARGTPLRQQAATRQSPFMATYVHRSSPAYNHPSLSGLRATGDATLRGDPFAGRSKSQNIMRSDYTHLTLTVDQCCSLKTYSSAGDFKPMGFNWVVPCATRQRDNSITYDSRGTFVDIQKCVFMFKNVTKQDIRIVINSPRGLIKKPDLPFVRENRREVVLNAGRVFKYKCHWGDSTNIYMPMMLYTGYELSSERMKICFAVADFAVIVPDIDEMSGKPIAELKAQNVVELSVDMRYIVSTLIGGNNPSEVVSKSDPFVVRRLSGFKELFFEEPWIVPAETPLIHVAHKHVMVGGVCQLVSANGGPHGYNLAEGRFYHGCGKVYKAVDGCAVLWDVEFDAPASHHETSMLPPGLPLELLPKSPTMIAFKDLIGYLSAVVKILTIVASVI